MSISKIKKDLEGQKKFPPVDQWNPDLCEGQEFFIDCLLYTSPSPRDED